MKFNFFKSKEEAYKKPEERNWDEENKKWLEKVKIKNPGVADKELQALVIKELTERQEELDKDLSRMVELDTAQALNASLNHADIKWFLKEAKERGVTE